MAEDFEVKTEGFLELFFSYVTVFVIRFCNKRNNSGESCSI